MSVLICLGQQFQISILSRCRAYLQHLNVFLLYERYHWPYWYRPQLDLHFNGEIKCLLAISSQCVELVGARHLYWLRLFSPTQYFWMVFSVPTTVKIPGTDSSGLLFNQYIGEAVRACIIYVCSARRERRFGAISPSDHPATRQSNSSTGHLYKVFQNLLSHQHCGFKISWLSVCSFIAAPSRRADCCWPGP
jgi:hypothetical protein